MSRGAITSGIVLSLLIILRVRRCRLSTATRKPVNCENLALTRHVPHSRCADPCSSRPRHVSDLRARAPLSRCFT